MVLITELCNSEIILLPTREASDHIVEMTVSDQLSEAELGVTCAPVHVFWKARG
jgi:hypothetical protein